MTSRIPTIFTILICTAALLAFATPLTISHFLSVQDVECRALSDLGICKDLCKQIKELKVSVPEQTDRESSSEETVSRVRQGLLQSGIDENLLGEIKIIGRTAIPNTSFAREDTSVSLKGIDLKSLFAFIASQESGKDRILCSGIDIQIAKSREESGQAIWTPQLTLTQLTKVGKRTPIAR